MTQDRAQRLFLPRVKIMSIVESYNAFSSDPIQVRGGWAKRVTDLYNTAGVGPKDMDFLQAYDDYPVIAMMQIEDLGFCDKGDGPSYVNDTPLTVLGGGLPLNTSGGQLSAGQAGAAGGFLGITETLRQLIKQPQGLQVPDAHTGLVSGYGYVNFDRGICSNAAILQSLN